jgi:hypothetical protein
MDENSMACVRASLIGQADGRRAVFVLDVAAAGCVCYLFMA